MRLVEFETPKVDLSDTVSDKAFSAAMDMINTQTKGKSTGSAKLKNKLMKMWRSGDKRLSSYEPGFKSFGVDLRKVIKNL